MKKNIIILVAVFSTLIVTAQTSVDVLKYLQTDINGTARYMSMAGAFGALGGDVSSIKDNPAGLGIYRSSDLNISANIQMQNSTSTWNGSKASDNMYNTRLNNFSYVMAYPSWKAENGYTDGLLYSNWSLSYNRLKSLDRNIYAKRSDMSASLMDFMAYLPNISGYDFTEDEIRRFDDLDVAWLSALGANGQLIDKVGDSWVGKYGGVINPSLTMSERGYVDEYAISWSANFSNRFYLGVGANLKTMSYRMYSTYRETFNAGNFRLENDYTSSGVGVDLSIGVIYKITDALRVSGAFHTPTVYSISEYYYPTLTSNVNSSSPGQSAANSYRLTSPLQVNAGVAYVLGKKAVISAEYVFNAYSNSKLADNKGRTSTYQYENEDIKEMVNNGHTVKIGAEYRLSPNWSLRAGFATMNAMTNSNAEKRMWSNTVRTDAEFFAQNTINYITAGLGYQNKGWYLDFAYVHKENKQQYTPFNLNNTGIADIVVRNNNIVLTYGLRF